MVLQFIDSIGNYFIKTFEQVGRFTLFFLKICQTLLTKKPKFRQIVFQMEQIGVKSVTIVILTGLSAGFVIALQAYTALSQFGGENLMGMIVAFGITRELGPVLTGIMVTGRAGSAMAAELGVMKITEQIDALRTLCINEYQYLIIPRIIASTLILPFLTTLAMFFGLIGGYIYNTSIVELNSEIYFSSIKSHLVIFDIIGGLIKSAIFGLILSLVGTYIGFHTKGGAQGVGVSTTKSVVVGSIIIVIANYFLSIILF